MSKIYANLPNQIFSQMIMSCVVSVLLRDLVFLHGVLKSFKLETFFLLKVCSFNLSTKFFKRNMSSTDT